MTKLAATEKLTKGEATRLGIKLAAIEVFASDGFAHAKVATIMAAANRTPGAFYKHFESKEALLQELLEDFRLQLKMEVNRPLRDEEDVSRNLIERTGAFWKVYRANWAVATAAFQLSMLDERFADAWRRVRRQGIRGLSAVIREAQKQGFCPSVNVELTASALCSMLEYTCYNWTSARGDFPGKSIGDEHAGAALMQIIGHAILWKKPALDDQDLISSYILGAR